jgi:hypothetical protein
MEERVVAKNVCMMKKNKLVWFKVYNRNGKLGSYNFDDPIAFLCTKNDVKENKLDYSSPKYLTETTLLDWKELDNCNFLEKVIYRINIPKWISKFIYSLILLLVGAWVNSLFCN